MKARFRLAISCVAVLASAAMTVGPSQAGDLRLVTLPSPTTVGLAGSWAGAPSRWCAGETINPCLYESWNTGLGNGQYRTWISQAVRVQTITARNRAVKNLLRAYGFQITAQTRSTNGGITTIKSVGRWSPFYGIASGHGRQIVAFYGTRVIETFIGLGPNAPQHGAPTLARMTSITRPLTLPSAGAIPLGTIH